MKKRIGKSTIGILAMSGMFFLSASTAFAGSPVRTVDGSVTQIDTSNGPVQVTYGPSDPIYTALITTMPSLIQNSFQDMKTYLGLNILKYTEQMSRLDAINPPSASLSKSNGAYIFANKSFTNYWEQLFNSSSLSRTILHSAGGDPNASMVARHLVNYCSNEEAKQKLCSPASTDGAGNYIGAADLTANTLLGFKSFPNSALNPAAGGGAGKPAPFQIAAMDFVNNLTNPQPVGLQKSAIFSSPMTRTTNIRGQAASFLPTSSTGDQPLAALYSAAALLSVPQTILINMVAERTQIPGLGTALGITDSTKANISEWEALQYEATRRFTSETWHEGINDSPSAALLREIANIGAVQLALQAKQLEQNEEIKLLLASQVAYFAQASMKGISAGQQNNQGTPSITP